MMNLTTTKRKKVLVIVLITLLVIIALFEAFCLLIYGEIFISNGEYIRKFDSLYVRVQDVHAGLTHIVDKGFNGSLTDQDYSEYQDLIKSNNSLVDEQNAIITSMGN